MGKIKKYWTKFKYLGYDKQTIEDIRIKLEEDNIRITERVSLILICILAIIVVFYSVFDLNIIRNCICFAAVIIMAGIYMISKAMLDKKFTYTAVQVDILIDILSFICFIIAIYLGTFAVGDELAVCKGTNLVYQDVFQQADEALYRAKNEGKNTYRITR